jgi:hypothetical protein
MIKKIAGLLLSEYPWELELADFSPSHDIPTPKISSKDSRLEVSIRHDLEEIVVSTPRMPQPIPCPTV